MNPWSARTRSVLCREGFARLVGLYPAGGMFIWTMFGERPSCSEDQGGRAFSHDVDSVYIGEKTPGGIWFRPLPECYGGLEVGHSRFTIRPSLLRVCCCEPELVGVRWFILE